MHTCFYFVSWARLSTCKTHSKKHCTSLQKSSHGSKLLPCSIASLSFPTALEVWSSRLAHRFSCDPSFRFWDLTFPLSPRCLLHVILAASFVFPAGNVLNFAASLFIAHIGFRILVLFREGPSQSQAGPMYALGSIRPAANTVPRPNSSNLINRLSQSVK